jgi:putative transcriptional regulator
MWPGTLGGGYELSGVRCAVGPHSPFTWNVPASTPDGPGDLLWWLIVATDIPFFFKSAPLAPQMSPVFLFAMLYFMYVIAYTSGMGLRNHLRQHRARLELTQQELGRRVGVRRQTIIAIEKGHYVPSAILAFRIARELEMKVDDLFELIEEAGEEPR